MRAGGAGRGWATGRAPQASGRWSSRRLWAAPTPTPTRTCVSVAPGTRAHAERERRVPASRRVPWVRPREEPPPLVTRDPRTSAAWGKAGGSLDAAGRTWTEKPHPLASPTPSRSPPALAGPLSPPSLGATWNSVGASALSGDAQLCGVRSSPASSQRVYTAPQDPTVSTARSPGARTGPVRADPARCSRICPRLTSWSTTLTPHPAETAAAKVAEREDSTDSALASELPVPASHG